MKKLKLIPGLILLALCVAVLGIGIYAASPASNQITGTVTVNAANAPIKIQAFLGTVEGNHPLTSEVTTRTSASLNLDENSATTTMEFDASEADSISGVDDVIVTFRVTNLSTSKALGVYFSDTAQAGALTASTRDHILRARTFDDVTNSTNDVISAVFTGYKQIASGGTNHVDMTMRMSLNALYESTKTINLSNIDSTSATYKVCINVEEYNSSLVDASGSALDNAKWASDIGWYVEMGQGRDQVWENNNPMLEYELIQDNGPVNLRWRPIGRALATTGSATTASNILFASVNTTNYYVSSEGAVNQYTDITNSTSGTGEVMKKLVSDDYTFVQAEGYSLYTNPASGYGDGAGHYRYDDSSNAYYQSDIQTMITTGVSTYYNINTSADKVYPNIKSTVPTEEIVNVRGDYRGNNEDLYASCSDKLFLLSALEVGYQYTFFSHSTNSVSNIEYTLNGSDVSWWLRSPCPMDGDTSYALNARDAGKVYIGEVSYDGCSVRPAFKIAL